MALSFYPVVSLRQMAMTKVALIVCNDSEIWDFVKENGCISFIFPSKETCMFLKQVKGNYSRAWTSEECMEERHHGAMFTIFDVVREQKSNFIWEQKKDVLIFGEWEALVNKKLSSFLLPQVLEQALVEVIRTVSNEIDRWIKDHALIWANPVDIANRVHHYFQWNSLGKIDRVETAKMLIRNQTLDIADLYAVALHYGLTSMLSGRRTLGCMSVDKRYSDLILRNNPKMHWKPFTGTSDFNYNAQREYFSTSCPEQNKICLTRILSLEWMQYKDLIFCLKQMGVDEREAVFKKHSRKLLMYFLDWSLQFQFLEAAELLLPYMRKKDFVHILIAILYERIMLGRKDYISLLRGLWSKASISLIDSIKENPIYRPLMFTLNFPDWETFPNEQLLKSNPDECLSFNYWGIQYCVYTLKTPGAIAFNYSLDDFKKSYFCKNRFIHAYYFTEKRNRQTKRKTLNIQKILRRNLVLSNHRVS